MEISEKNFNYLDNKIFKVKFRSDGAVAIINIRENKIRVFKDVDKKIIILLLKHLKISYVEKLILEKAGENKENLLIRFKYIINELKDISFINETSNSTSYECDFDRENLEIYKKSLTKSLDEIYIELTKKCNLRCHHCYIDNDVLKKELPTVKILEIIDQAADMGVLRIKLTGGEPFVHKDFFEIARYIKMKNILLRVYTNGTDLNKDTG